MRPQNLQKLVLMKTKTSEKISNYFISYAQNTNSVTLYGKYSKYSYISRCTGCSSKMVKQVFDKFIDLKLIKRQTKHYVDGDDYTTSNAFDFDLLSFHFYFKEIKRLTATEYRILSIIAKNPTLTQLEISNRLGKTYNFVKVYTHKLREKGYLTNDNNLIKGVDLNIVDFLTNER